MAGGDGRVPGRPGPSPTPGTLAYPAEVYTLEALSRSLRLQLNGQDLGTVATPENFRAVFVYRDRQGQETLSPTYQGMAQGDALLTALGLVATGGGGENRTLTTRIPVGSGAVRVREVRGCGGRASRPGLGTVTVVVDPNAPGGGDLTLG
ncbi:MAG: hypothetical protein ACK4G4_12180, partial [Thermus sp.]|uniref:hypothetical protein n=1 Tax=Thermus sp. TaxID=275 RepID=UPI003918ED68